MVLFKSWIEDQGGIQMSLHTKWFLVYAVLLAAPIAIIVGYFFDNSLICIATFLAIFFVASIILRATYQGEPPWYMKDNDNYYR
jgi:hypothetical protein